MSAVVKSFQVGAAALAVAAAGVLTPVIAQADEPSGSDSASVGNAAGKSTARKNRGKTPGASAPSSPSTPSDPSAPDAPPAPSADATASATGSNPLIQNPLIWIGQPNPTPPPSSTIYNFEPLADLPSFTRPMFGWMKDFEFEACALGLANVNRGQNVVGPYGTSTWSFSSSGC